MVYMQELLHQLEEQNIVLPTAELRESAQVVREFDSSDTEHKGDFPDFPSYAPHLGTLWACEAVQQQYRDTERLKYQKVKVFFDKLDEVGCTYHSTPVPQPSFIRTPPPLPPAIMFPSYLPSYARPNPL